MLTRTHTGKRKWTNAAHYSRQFVAVSLALSLICYVCFVAQPQPHSQLNASHSFCTRLALNFIFSTSFRCFRRTLTYNDSEHLAHANECAHEYSNRKSVGYSQIERKRTKIKITKIISVDVCIQYFEYYIRAYGRIMKQKRRMKGKKRTLNNNNNLRKRSIACDWRYSVVRYFFYSLLLDIRKQQAESPRKNVGKKSTENTQTHTNSELCIDSERCVCVRLWRVLFFCFFRFRFWVFIFRLECRVVSCMNCRAPSINGPVCVRICGYCLR